MAFRDRWASVEEEFSTPYRQLLLIGGIVFVLGALLAFALGTTDSETGAATVGFGPPPVIVRPSPLFVSSGELFAPLRHYEYADASESVVAATKGKLTTLLPAGSVESVEIREVTDGPQEVGFVAVLVVDAGVMTPTFEADVGAGIASSMGTTPEPVNVAGRDGYLLLQKNVTAYVFVSGNAVIEVAGVDGKDIARVTRLLLQAL